SLDSPAPAASCWTVPRGSFARPCCPTRLLTTCRSAPRRDQGRWWIGWLPGGFIDAVRTAVKERDLERRVECPFSRVGLRYSQPTTRVPIWRQRNESAR